jgi:hypothetical protein
MLSFAANLINMLVFRAEDTAGLVTPPGFDTSKKSQLPHQRAFLFKKFL